MKQTDSQNDPVLMQIQENGLAMLTLNRPGALNALSPDLVACLEEKFLEAGNCRDVRAIAIQGAGKAFAAGADIGFFTRSINSGAFSGILAFTRNTSFLFRAIETSNKPTVAVLNGFSLGGGSELALACQAILATPRGSLGFPETGIGIFPGLGGMPRLAKKIGPALARYYVFTGETIPSGTALDLGIFNRVAPQEEMESLLDFFAGKGSIPKDPEKRPGPPLSGHLKSIQALFSGKDLSRILDMVTTLAPDYTPAGSIAARLAQKAPLALKLAHEIMTLQEGKPMQEALEIELDRIKEIFSTRDALEGLTSVGHRIPEFQGN